MARMLVGQVPPAVSAIASNGRQLSAARLNRLPVSGSLAAKSFRWSVVHRAILRVSCLNSSARSARNCFTRSLDFLRRNLTITARSSSVSGSLPLSAPKDIDPIPRPPAIFQIEQFASLSPNPLTAFSPIRKLICTVPHSSSVVVGCIKLCSGHSAPNYLIHNDPKSMPLRCCAVHEFRTASVMVATLAFTQEGARRTRKRCPLWVISRYFAMLDSDVHFTPEEWTCAVQLGMSALCQ